ncbi:MAG: DUF190 domain-containing protein [Caldilineaceae bacterium]|nr:DUF190 domain-containing protein [Caldilineaceae bacterium]
MQLQGKAKRITIYIGEDNQYRGRPLYLALLDFLKRENAAGATVLRGTAGFGAHSRIHTSSIVSLSSDLPIRLEWIDWPETIERLMPSIRRMVDDGLITIEDVEVLQYAPGRLADPLTQPVHNIMRSEVTAVTPDTPVTAVVNLLLRRGHRSLPVLDKQGRVAGIITDGDLLRRAGLEARLSLQSDLALAQAQAQLAMMDKQAQSAGDVMTTPVTTVYNDEPVRAAVERMVERGLKRLPVVDRSGRLVGHVSRLDVLRSIDYHQPEPAPSHSAPRHGATVRELMNPDTPTVGPSARLNDILNALETSRQLRVVVVDLSRRPLGIITDGDLLRRSRAAERPGLLPRLRSLFGGPRRPFPPLAESNEIAADLMTSPVETISVNTPPAEALRLMVEKQIKRLPVVDDKGRLVGLLGRASLLNWVLASSEEASAAEDVTNTSDSQLEAG